MKRSRHPRYDKRRPSKKKEAIRNFKFEVKNNTTSSGEQRKQTEPKREEKSYTERKTYPKKQRSFSVGKWPLGIIVLIFLVKLILNVERCQSISETPIRDNSSVKDIYTTPNYRTTKKTRRNTPKIRVADYIVGKRKRLREVIQLQKDSLFPIIPHVNIRLFKGFHIYDPANFTNTPILAKFSKYYFFYNVEDVSDSETLTQQWARLRKTITDKVFYSDFKYNDYKSFSFKNTLTIEEKEFTITTEGKSLHGVATLIESKNKRYFFHFISKEKQEKVPNYRYLARYLNYYLKIR